MAQTVENHQSPARWLIVIVPYLWLAFFFLVPFFIVLKISLSDMAIAMPPYTPTFGGFGAIGDFISKLDFENYTFLGSDSLYVSAYLNSVRIAVISTFLLLLIGYPMALGMARAPATIRPMLVMLVILPFWTSFLIRVYAWIGILKPEGLLTVLFQGIGILGPDQQVNIFRTDYAVFIGVVYSYLPFMILPLYANLEKLDNTLNEAAMDLGSRPSQVFRDVTLPLSVPGIIAGGLLVFIPASGELVIPSLVGNAYDPMIGRVISDEFSSARDWPMAAAVAVALLLLLVVPMMAYTHFEAKAQAGQDRG